MKQRIESVIWKTRWKKTTRQSRKKKILNKKSSRNILNNMNHNNIYIMGVPEGEDSKQEIKNILEEIMTYKKK